MWSVVQTHKLQTHPSLIVYINSAPRLFQLNDICFARQWLHLALLFVTVQPIFQSAVSKDRSETIKIQTSVGLISSTLRNYTCPCVLRDVDLGKQIAPLSAHFKTERRALDSIKERSVKWTVLTGWRCHSHSCNNQWWKCMMKHLLSLIHQKWHQHTSRCSQGVNGSVEGWCRTSAHLKVMLE